MLQWRTAHAVHEEILGRGRMHCATARHWEQGEDVRLLEFKAIQYKRRGKVIATAEQLQRIARAPKREFMRRGINQHTLEKICRKEVVRASRLAKVLTVLQQWESEHNGKHK